MFFLSSIQIIIPSKFLSSPILYVCNCIPTKFLYFSYFYVFVLLCFIQKGLVMIQKGPFGCADKPAEKHCRLICCERKILFRLKKQAEKDGL
jgi:hypothetical protein